MSNWQKAFHDELNRLMAQQHFATRAEAEAFVRDYMVRSNQTPVDDFCGLTPDQMRAFLDEPIDCSSVVQIGAGITSLSQSPIMFYFGILAEAIGEKGLKPTAAGNLPRALVRQAAEAGYERFPPAFMVPLDRLFREDDFPDLHTTRIVAQVAGAIRKYKGKFILSRDCRGLIQDFGMPAVFSWLLVTYIEQYNWGYRGRGREIPLVQDAALFSLYLLHRFGGTWRPSAFYEDAFLRAFPQALDQAPDLSYCSPEHTVRSNYRWDTLRHCACFLGLAEWRPRDKDEYVDYEVRKLPLLDQAILFSPDLPK